MIVECFGLPGSGKSTLVRRLVREGDYVEPPQYVSKRYSFMFLMYHPLYVLRYLLALIRESMYPGSFFLLRFKIAVFLHSVGRLQYAKKNFPPEKVVLLDEGILQRLLSLSERENSSARYRTLVNRRVLADKVLLVSSELITADTVRVLPLRKKRGEEEVQKWRHVLITNHRALQEVIEAEDIPRCAYQHGKGSETTRRDNSDYTALLECVKNKSSNKQ